MDLLVVVLSKVKKVKVGNGGAALLSGRRDSSAKHSSWLSRGRKELGVVAFVLSLSLCGTSGTVNMLCLCGNSYV